MDPKVVEIASIGQVPVAVDWLWLQILVDAEVYHVEKGTHPVLYENLDLATKLDPAFFEAYYMGANLLAVIRDDGVGARDLLERGERFRKEKLPGYPEEFRNREWSSAWTVPLLLAYVELFELNDLPRAADAFREADALPGAPAYVHSLSRRFAEPGGAYAVGLRLLTFLESSARDDSLRDEFRKKREALQVGQFMNEVNAEFRAFLGRLPAYRASTSVGSAELRRYWDQFRKETGRADRDPWGGALAPDAQGRIVTTTPRAKVFGLD